MVPLPTFIPLPSDPNTRLTAAQLAQVTALFDAHGGDALKQHLLTLVHADERTGYGLTNALEDVLLFDGRGHDLRAPSVESEE